MIYDSKLVGRKKIWIIILSVCLLIAAYLYYVKTDRAASVKNYSSQPRVGDIYKIRQETYKEGVSVFYMKVIKIEEQDIHFIRSRMILTMPNDALLKQFDPTRPVVYTKDELAAIAAGKWMTASQDDTELIEIDRK